MKEILIVIISTVLLFSNLNSKSKEWFETGELIQYPSSLYFSGLGEGSNIEDAISSAQLIVASQIRVSIEGKVTSITQEFQTNDKVSYSEYFQQSTKMVVDETIQGIEIVKQKNVKGKYFALAVLDKDKYISSLKVELDCLTETITILINTGSKFVEEGNIIFGLENYFEAQNFIPQFYSKFAFYNALSVFPYSINNKINIDIQLSEIKAILSAIKFEIVSGNNQKTKVGNLLPSPIIVSVLYKKKPLINFPIIVKNEDNSLIQKSMSDESGLLSIWIKALPSENSKNKIIIKSNLQNLASSFRKYLTTETSASYETSLTIPIEFSISITNQKGKHLDKVESKISKSIIRMGYSINKNAILGLEGVVSVEDTQEVDGYQGTQFLTESELTLFLIIKSNKKKVGSLFAKGKGLSSKNEIKSIEASYKKLKINKMDLVEILADAEVELNKIFEKESADFLNEGKILYKQNKLKEAILSLAKVTHGENQIQEAVKLANSIRNQLNELEEAKIQRKIAEKEKQRNFKLEQIRIVAETERLRIESEEKKALSEDKTEQMKIQAEVKKTRIINENIEKEGE